MKPGDIRITVNWVERGQPRAYADHVYKARMLIEWVPGSIYHESNAFYPWDSLYIDNVKEYAKVMIHNFSDNPEWWEARLKSIDKIGDGVWEVTIIEPYLD